MYFTKLYCTWIKTNMIRFEDNFDECLLKDINKCNLLYLLLYRKMWNENTITREVFTILVLLAKEMKSKVLQFVSAVLFRLPPTKLLNLKSSVYHNLDFLSRLKNNVCIQIHLLFLHFKKYTLLFYELIIIVSHITRT